MRPAIVCERFRYSPGASKGKKKEYLSGPLYQYQRNIWDYILSTLFCLLQIDLVSIRGVWKEKQDWVLRKENELHSPIMA